MTKKIAAVLLLTTVTGFAAPKPKITMKQARATALKAAPGKIKSEELENEKGKLIYSFDIATRSGITEVNVDAITGKVIETKHETPAEEAKEKAKEKAKH